jgi:hypothetical protein
VKILLIILFVLLIVIFIIKYPCKQKVKLVIILKNINNKSMNKLTIGAPDLAVILGLVDTDTQKPIAATFANVSISIADTTIAEIETDPNVTGQSDVKPLAVGTTTLNVTADATYTDGNTGESVTKTGLTASTDVTVAEGVENVGLVVSLAALTPQA